MMAATMLMIAAESLGLASSWIEGFEEESVRQTFGIPDDHALCGLIALVLCPRATPPSPADSGSITPASTSTSDSPGPQAIRLLRANTVQFT